MSDITTPEADKIITEFMGQCWHGHIINGECQQCFTLLSGKVRTIYSKSLDALVPVWEKMKKFDELCFTLWSHSKINESDDADKLYSAEHCMDGCKFIGQLKFSPQEAAAIATAKAILELNKKDKE